MPEIIHLHRATVAHCPPCHGRCRQGRDCPELACAPEGGKHADPVPSGLVSMQRHNRTRRLVLLALLFAVAGGVSRWLWPLAGA